MRGLVLVVCAAAVLAGGCRKRRSHNQSSPEQALTSFFEALRRGHIPADLEQLVATEEERTSWRFRWESRGCKGGSFQVLERETSDYEATLVVDYEVTGHEGYQVMSGERSPIQLTRDQRGWSIARFGRQIGVSPKPPASGGQEASGAAAEDAAPAAAAARDAEGLGGAPAERDGPDQPASGGTRQGPPTERPREPDQPASGETPQGS
jgi:hypothetical protein